MGVGKELTLLCSTVEEHMGRSKEKRGDVFLLTGVVNSFTLSTAVGRVNRPKALVGLEGCLIATQCCAAVAAISVAIMQFV